MHTISDTMLSIIQVTIATGLITLMIIYPVEDVTSYITSTHAYQILITEYININYKYLVADMTLGMGTGFLLFYIFTPSTYIKPYV